MDSEPRSTPAPVASNDSALFLGLAAVVLFFLATGIIAYLNTSTLYADAKAVTKTHNVLIALRDVASLAKDAETGQRGYLLTGEEAYLEPYAAALARLESRLSELEQLVEANPTQKARLPGVKMPLDTKLKELAETIRVRKQQGLDAARSIVLSDRGKNAMDQLRERLGEMEAAELAVRHARLEEMSAAYRTALVSGMLTGLLGIVLTVAIAILARRAMQTRRRQQWLLAGESGVRAALLGDKNLEDLGGSVLRFLSDYLGVHAGAVYANSPGGPRRVAASGVVEKDLPEAFGPGEGLLGRAIHEGRTLLIRDVPEGYLTIGSALGRGKPRHLVLVPARADRSVNAVIELGFMDALAPATLELLDKVSESLGVAVRSANDRTRLQNLLEETQRQAVELQAQGEELRVSNEELEEQGRALRESQARLEAQQAELEQTNTQLEDQARVLEAQRDDIARAQVGLEAKALELEQASRYKSDFLANMSHELRTPLNSALILAKLLADNRTQNLSEEQVQYAETIWSSGNDLLNLVNDILDLSKIEAGHMQVHAETLGVKDLVESLRRTFEPIASQKGLRFDSRFAADAPDSIETDRQRLEQILKNLLSNAVKFTAAGEVELAVGSNPDGLVAFSVRDTGIGIPEHQQEMVFEAFRQADGTTNRKYGGTGLGLSISRELARLLGGELRVVSQPGIGSTFTVLVPAKYSPSAVPSRERNAKITAPSHPVMPRAIPATPQLVVDPSRRIKDDREKLVANRRVLLVVEDDENFARILYDLAHELDFQCLIAGGAEEAVAMAVQYLPGAVVLDIGLPDHSGLAVLDRLKHDARTRHIPVHVVSASDHAQTALALGAVGYMVKPVKRDELANALRGLEMRLSQRLRRVLIVEDDPIQMESLKRLLDSTDLETVGVATAADCLNRLREETFDCMVLDLTLPDASGYSLLETLSREDAYSFPPVIVYTARDLTPDEEQRLRRYSKSIIIKGAKSPERLLDEVTLFLHQVVSELPPEQQRILEKARSRDSALEGRRILIVEDDVRNIFALTSVLEPRGSMIEIARNGREALASLEKFQREGKVIDLVLMDVMMPEMDGLTATREIRKRPEWKKLPVIMLSAKAMKDDQENCLSAGANDYMAKPLDVDKLLSLVRVWMPR